MKQLLKDRVVPALDKADHFWAEVNKRIGPALEMVKTCYLLAMMIFISFALPDVMKDPGFQRQAAAITTWQDRMVFAVGIQEGILILSGILIAPYFLVTAMAVALKWIDETPSRKKGGDNHGTEESRIC